MDLYLPADFHALHAIARHERNAPGTPHVAPLREERAWLGAEALVAPALFARLAEAMSAAPAERVADYALVAG